tara:strand:+ start:10466 stop:10654 length:189 start_codon:yes stop_codon:yes gene_type:complete
MIYVTIAFIVFVMLDVGIVIGWCLRAALTRAQKEIRHPWEQGHFTTRREGVGGGTGFIARWN